jgi:hypothetical protein
LTVLLIVVALTITHDVLDGFGQMDSLNPSPCLEKQIFPALDAFRWIHIQW